MYKVSPSASIDDYIAEFPPSVRSKLQEVRSAIRKAVPAATEKISYRIPTFYLNGNLVHFAAFRRHIGLYPGPKAISELSKDLIGYKTATGTIQLPLDEPIPVQLISKIVKFCVATRAAAKPRSRK